MRKDLKNEEGWGRKGEVGIGSGRGGRGKREGTKKRLTRAERAGKKGVVRKS